MRTWLRSMTSSKPRASAARSGCRPTAFYGIVSHTKARGVMDGGSEPGPLDFAYLFKVVVRLSARSDELSFLGRILRRDLCVADRPDPLVDRVLGLTGFAR
jgi:hypothetical protein